METSDTQDPVLLPEGVAEPGGHTGFFAVGTAAVEAIDLADGSLLWHTAAAIRPLLVVRHLLAAQAPVPGRRNALRIVLLDVRNGEPVLRSEPVLLPEWVDACARAPETFLCRARLEAQALVVAWEAHARYSGGAAPPREVLRQANREAAGTVRIDLDTGRAEAAAPESPGASLSAGTLRESDAPPSSPDVVWQTEPWQTGDRLAALAMKQEVPGLSLRLETRSRGASPAAAEQVELARGAGMVPSLSADGRYVLVEPDEPSPVSPGAPRPWWVFETATGRRIATVPHEEGARQPCVVGGRLFYLVQEPLQPAPGQEVRTLVRSRDLGSGALLWERPLAPPTTARAPELPR